MEPKNDGFQKEFPFPGTSFQGLNPWSKSSIGFFHAAQPCIPFLLPRNDISNSSWRVNFMSFSTNWKTGQKSINWHYCWHHCWDHHHHHHHHQHHHDEHNNTNNNHHQHHHHHHHHRHRMRPWLTQLAQGRKPCSSVGIAWTSFSSTS